MCLFPHHAHLAIFPEMKCNLNGELLSAIGGGVTVDCGTQGTVGPGGGGATGGKLAPC